MAELVEDVWTVLAGTVITLLTLAIYCTLMFRPQWFWKMISFLSFKANEKKTEALTNEDSGERVVTTTKLKPKVVPNPRIRSVKSQSHSFEKNRPSTFKKKELNRGTKLAGTKDHQPLTSSPVKAETSAGWKSLGRPHGKNLMDDGVKNKQQNKSHNFSSKAMKEDRDKRHSYEDKGLHQKRTITSSQGPKNKMADRKTDLSHSQQLPRSKLPHGEKQPAGTKDVKGQMIDRKTDVTHGQKLPRGGIPQKKNQPGDAKVKTGKIERLQKIWCNLTNGFYNFTLDAKGGVLSLSFLEIQFPSGCLRRRRKLKLRRVPAKEMRQKRGVTFITPQIEFYEEGSSSVRFQSPIELRVRLLRYRVDHPKHVQVEVTDNINEENWVKTETLKLLKNQQFISIELQRFASLRVLADSSKGLVPAHYIFHAVFVKRPTEISDPREHSFYVLIYSSHDRILRQAEGILHSPSVEEVGHREVMSIRPPCTFTASLTCDGMTSSPESMDCDIDDDKPVLKTDAITITKNHDEEIHPLQTIHLGYTAWTTEPGSPKDLPFRWSVPADDRQHPSRSCSTASGITINARGDGSIGQKNLYHFSGPVTVQSPTPSEGTLNLPHNSSEPLLSAATHEAIHERSLPIDLSKVRPSEDNRWFSDKVQTSTPNQSSEE